MTGPWEMSEVNIEFAVGGEGGRNAARVVTGGWRFERKARQCLRMAGLYIYARVANGRWGSLQFKSQDPAMMSLILMEVL